MRFSYQTLKSITIRDKEIEKLTDKISSNFQDYQQLSTRFWISKAVLISRKIQFQNIRMKLIFKSWKLCSRYELSWTLTANISLNFQTIYFSFRHFLSRTCDNVTTCILLIQTMYLKCQHYLLRICNLISHIQLMIKSCVNFFNTFFICDLLFTWIIET